MKKAAAPMELYGVVDIGSNSIRLMIYEYRQGELIGLLNKKYSAGLASYVSAEGALSGEGMVVLIGTLSEIQRIISGIRLRQTFVYATASLRNIRNPAEVLAEVKKATGLSINVLSGQEEAFYDYYGVIESSRAADALICDVGGGSTEIIQMRSRKILLGESLPIGSLNSYSAYVRELVPSAKELSAIAGRAEKYLAALPARKPKPLFPELIGVGGSARGALRLYRCLYRHPTADRFPAGDLRKILDLLRKDKDRLVSAVIRTEPERIHTIGPGMAILAAVAEHYGAKEITVSPYGCREGFLSHTLKQKGLDDHG